MRNTCIIIAGPTAVGKTAIALALAKQFSTEIISCDSRQCFRELNIGVAKPSHDELEAVKHYFIDSHSIHDTVNAAVFEKYAIEKVNTIFEHTPLAIMVGGTGLYIKAFCEGIDEIPGRDPAVRTFVMEGYEANGIEWLQAEIKNHDEIFFAKGEMQNPQRMMRALEVKLCTGKSIFDFHSGNRIARNFDVIKIGLELPRPVLNERINKRVDMMMEAGLENEVRGLLPFRELNALQTVGYRELAGYFDHEVSLEQAVDAIKTNTRQYAKRQMTWFKKDTSVAWCEPDEKKVISVTGSLLK